MTSEPPKFVLDRELFSLCKALRMLGFDALDRGHLPLRDSIQRAIEERRIWIRKDSEAPSLQYGIRYFLVQADDVPGQLSEIQERYSIKESASPFSRCLKCNELLQDLPASRAQGKVPEAVVTAFEEFSICPACGRIYWPGSHLKRMKKKLEIWGWQNL